MDKCACPKDRISGLKKAEVRAETAEKEARGEAKKSVIAKLFSWANSPPCIWSSA